MDDLYHIWFGQEEMRTNRHEDISANITAFVTATDSAYFGYTYNELFKKVKLYSPEKE